MNKFLFENWQQISTAEKQALVKREIEKSALPFSIKGTHIFSQNGITIETVILENDGVEFIFVPGKNDVVLGWDNTCNLGKNVSNVYSAEFEADYKSDLENYREELNDLLSEIDNAIENNDGKKVIKLKQEYKEAENDLPKKKTIGELEKYILENTSNIRTANISPMIVQKDLEFIEEDISYSDFLKSFDNTLFTVPTEDEWEYLCGGGTRTFFRWGDSLEKELQVIYAIGTDNERELLYQPNMFGLNIAYDSYLFELVDSDCWAKGGDGGSSICGGKGCFYATPVFSAFYVPKVNKNSVLNSDYYCYRKIIRL
jgi:hypothetical protein